ncbi:hypothetical protein [Nioella sp.]|uniref:hypothetical protein n=1 Tax=Nioella sp. TaxID=1912091 RepID=UPI0035154919
MADPARWSDDQMIRLAARGAAKVDLLGERGATLVTCDEVAAMAAVILLGRIVPPGALTAPKKGASDV